jgi:hypothetical protein
MAFGLNPQMLVPPSSSLCRLPFTRTCPYLPDGKPILSPPFFAQYFMWFLISIIKNKNADNLPECRIAART